MVDVGYLPTVYPENPPFYIGWYAGEACWDANEGGFPCAFYWNGEAWETDHRPIYSYKPFRFDTKEEAEESAKNSNLGW